MNNRLTGLDLLRSIIMLFGPTFHAAMLYGGSWGFDYPLRQSETITQVLNLTHPFRMGLFFIISGFFSCLIIDKKGVDHFIESRKNRLIKPTLLAIVITLPLIAAEMYFLFGDRELNDYFSYKHLWFLVVLCQINMLLMIAPAKFNNLIKTMASWLNGVRWITLFSLFVMVVSCSMVIIKIIDPIIPEKLLEFTQLAGLVQYLPYFIIGMLLFYLNKDITNKCAAFMVLIYFAWYFLSIAFAGEFKVAMNFGKVVAVLSISLALFFIFKNMNIKQSLLITALSKLALPFYLTHLPILLFLGWAWSKGAISNEPIIFLTYIVATNIIVSFFISILIKRNRVMSRFLGLT